MFVLLGFLGLLLLVGGAVLGILAWENLRMASLLGRPLSRIAKLNPGCRKVRGKVASLGKPLRSPVTNKECVYYRLCVYRDMAPPKSSFENEGAVNVSRILGGFTGVLLYKSAVAVGESMPSWGTLLDDEVSIRAAVDDDTARVEVNLRGATVVCKEKSLLTTAWGVSKSIPTKLTELLREEYDIHIVDDRGRYKTLHIVEEALLVGAKVTVLGTVEPLKDGALCFQQRDGPLVVSERDLAEQGREARKRAIGYTAGAGAALGVGLCCLLGAFALVVKAMLAR